MRLSYRGLLLATLFLFGSSAAIAAGGETGTCSQASEATSGDGSRRSVLVKGVGETKRLALQDAARSAIAIVIGEYVSAETVIRNDELIKDEILSTSAGILEGIRECDTRELEGALHVSALITVSTASVRSHLQAHHIDVTGIAAEDALQIAAMQGARSGNRRDYLKVATELFEPMTSDGTAYATEITAVSLVDTPTCEVPRVRCFDAPSQSASRVENWSELRQFGELINVRLTFRMALTTQFLDQVAAFVASMGISTTGATKSGAPAFEIIKVGLKTNPLDRYSCGASEGICTHHLLGGPSRTFTVQPWQSQMLMRVLQSAEGPEIVRIRAKDGASKILREVAYNLRGEGARTNKYVPDASSSPASERLEWGLPHYTTRKNWRGQAVTERTSTGWVDAPVPFKHFARGVAPDTGSVTLLDNSDSSYTAIMYIPYKEFELVRSFEVALD